MPYAMAAALCMQAGMGATCSNTWATSTWMFLLPARQLMHGTRLSERWPGSQEGPRISGKEQRAEECWVGGGGGKNACSGKGSNGSKAQPLTHTSLMLGRRVCTMRHAPCAMHASDHT